MQSNIKVNFVQLYMSSQKTELIFVGNCSDLINSFKKTFKVCINEQNIKIKEGTPEFSSIYEKWSYYPLTFQCTDNIEPPTGTYIAGDFLFSTGYIKKINSDN